MEMPTVEAALVTGGTGALGRAVVSRFLADGMAVAVTYFSEKEWQDLAAAEADASRSGKLQGFRADLTDEAAVRGAVEAAVKSLGGLRVLAHLAGGYAGGVDLEQVDVKTVRQMIDTNLLTAMLAAKHVIPHAKRSGAGRLLFISSRGAIECYPGSGPYAAAKAGLLALAVTLSKELKESGVTANAVLPSVIDTAANRASMPKADHSTWVKPSEIAGLLSYLASRGAQSVSGALIPIYGRA
jgi:NAD(P)-dependent dehydrogenase (short-subunit alcohol dehydrogenase family)